MSSRFAVFNEHVNNARRKAMRSLGRRYGPEAQKCIRRYRRKGIMSIFGDEPTRHTLWYVGAVRHYVNEGRPRPKREND